MPTPGNVTFGGLLRTPLQIEGRLTQPWADFFVALAALPASLEDLARLVPILDRSEETGSVPLYGTYADRPTSVSVESGTLYVVTDRDGITYQARGANWVYVSGTYQRTQAQLAALAATLTANDNGLLIHVTDYDHILRWTNPGWGWGSGDARNAGQVAFFDADPGTGWKLLDGNGDDGQPIGVAHPIKILKSDGTTRDNTTAANATANVHVRGAAAYNGAVAPAVAPGITGDTAAEASHTHEGWPLGTSGPWTTANMTAGGVAVAASNHTHTITGSTAAGTSHNHGAGTLVNSLAGGDPVATTDALPYIRK